jgi:outer membrane protein assembly factor BamE (lipoprotein component of BamABCDE complex)
MSTQFIRASLLLFIGVLTACATSSNKPNAPTPSSNQEQQIIGKIPPDSPFSKLKIGMPLKQVHDLIGEPTDTENYQTGKMFIPFYFGDDTMRWEDIYKGQGRITYTGAGIGGVNFHVYQIKYDPTEDGYNKH